MKNYIKTVLLFIGIALSGCVQKEHEKTVTISVNMNDVKNFESIGIRGDFLPNRWKKTVPMTDENKDGVYEITFTEKTAVYGIEFKFVKNNIEFELQGQNNRELVFEYKPETIEYIATFNNNKNVKINRK
ncbi:MAG: hypothetical protein JXQ93_00900 [Flavobacteriaceae bacterium]